MPRRLLTFLLPALFLVGCGGGPQSPAERILAGIEPGPGVMKGDVYQALGPGPFHADADDPLLSFEIEYGYPLDRFYLDGSWYEVFWVLPEGFEPGDTLNWQEAIPVLSRDLVHVSWGWPAVGTWADENRVRLRTGTVPAGDAVPGGDEALSGDEVPAT